MNDHRKHIIWRIRMLYIFICVMSLLIFVKVCYIQFVEGGELKELAEDLTIDNKTIKAVRGNIYASDGSLLATSVPRYEIRMDVNADAIDDELFYENVDSLAWCLSNLFKYKSEQEYLKELTDARNSLSPSGRKGGRYHLLKRNATFTQLKKVKSFPILRKGRYKGGLIYLQKNRREKPFRHLAERTVGYYKTGASVGLERAYNEQLQGVNGKRLMQKIAGGDWKPINDENEIEPKNGYDLHTTIDINLQDVAENALLKQLTLHNADHGCVVLMEVNSGDIKAIANLKRKKTGGYYEGYNYAIGESTEPGSTFKLPVLMAAFEDGFINLEDKVDTEGGKKMFYTEKMEDTHDHGVVTIQRAFEVSSNIAIAKTINKYYQKNPEAFVKRLHQMGLNNQLGIEIHGEGTPRIKSPSSESWSGITLPWMAHGYEVLQTPLQVLTFYNAVANDGKMVKPRFVTEISDKGKLIESIPVQVINEQICSKSTIEKAKIMLEGVVNNEGTAQNLKNEAYRVSGKTGTAQMANDKYGYAYKSNRSYQASFVGFFPSENPKYSCIVVVNAPSKNVYYGNLVAGPIFKEVADKVYANSLQIHEELSEQEFYANSAIPYSKNGHHGDLLTIFNVLDIPMNEQGTKQWVVTSTADSIVHISDRTIPENAVPNVVGMGIRDAIFLLENVGLRVEFKGKGVVKNQSIQPGSPLRPGRTIKLQVA